MPAHSRQPGLDTLRALAIVLVFLYHYQVFVSHAPTFGWLGNVGWTGVDLFFVLSGYLIGHQVFAGIARVSACRCPRSTRAACCARCRPSGPCWRCTSCSRW